MVWALPGSRSSLPASLVLLLPLLAAPQQLFVSSFRNAIQPSGQTSDSAATASVDSTDQRPRFPVKSTDVSALATLALGASAPAVRAPPVQISSRAAGTASHASPAPQLPARSLQDWEVEDFVLLATVDGSIHARDRKTGAPRWALEVPSSPMVETIYHRANQTALTDSDIRPQDDYLWIVEPSRDGNLFIYHPGPNAGLQRLGITVKNLVDETPYSGTDPPVTYTARKETTLYTVDARTGAILRVFSSHGSVPAEPTCRRVNELGVLVEGDECEEPGRTLTLGRIEYTVAIQDTETGMPICTIKYSEWSPNNRDADLQSQYFTSMDDRHIYSMHDGVIFGFDHSKVDGRRYTQRLSSPVARVFDVARPIGPDSDDAPLIMLPQPPSDVDFGSVAIEGRDSRVFVNCTEKGGWYAMSELTYPLVTGRARQAECYEKDFLADNQPLMSLNLAQQKAALVGVHSLVESPSQFHRNIPSISGPPAESSNDTPRDVDSPPHSHLAPSSVPPFSGMVQRGWNSLADVFVTLIVLIVGALLYFNSGNIRNVAKQKLDLNHILSLQDPTSIPATPVVPSSSVSNPTEEVQVPTEQPADDLPVSPRANDEDVLQSQGSPKVKGSRPRVTIKEAPHPDGEEEVDDPTVKSPEKRQKARRGRRGGQAHKRKKKVFPESGDDQKGNGQSTAVATNGVHPHAALKPHPPLSRTVSTEMMDSDGMIRIGQLKVDTSKVLGHGSHGTVVYKGSFDGRDVAVKRMLVEFYDVAAHEVGLLQESDDHHNVIRYFCREQTAGFLYIALELCPASLQDIIERPQDYPNLVTSNLAVPDMLRQITAGVRYLHSLKIVHRDLKPQNILVAAPKSRMAAPGALRLLISDFGLCKKLEDNQSSFRATTAHAAGTSGWRAPELLVDDDQNPPNGPNPGSVGEHSTDTSEPAVVDPQTNRRATRAIDIFSLGCIFYYVLTRGGHPYDKDGKFMREANIVKGNHNLDDLQRLGDYAFEADDLIRKMLSRDPRKRPDATSVMIHPFFWSPTDRLSFLCDVSDHFEFEPRDPPSPALLCLESVALAVMGPEMDFLKLLPRDFKDSLGKQRKYTGSRMLDLLRALRNKRNHYNDMPEHLKAHIGGLPEGYLQFWTVRFPSLLINCHWVVVQLGLTQSDRFRRYFALPE
ncbi:hypothetical protein VTO42DRAFT_6958 [Malbranchea cinnamomea]